MARPVWKGYLGFGLVQLPVQLHPATQEDDIELTMLDKKTMSPVGYKRYDKKTKKEVAYSDIVKGAEVGKGKYVVIGPGDLKAAHPRATRSIDISDFVDATEISPVRWSNSYFVAPDPKASPKPYAVLREALKKTGKVGIAKIVLRTRQHLAAVTVEGDSIVLAILRFDDELRDAKELDEIAAAKKEKATQKEVALAEKLIETMSGPWKSDQYRDDYEDALRKYIAAKVKRGEVDAAPDVETEEDEVAPTEPVDLLEALKASLGKKEKRSTPARARKTARRGGTHKRPSAHAHAA